MVEVFPFYLRFIKGCNISHQFICRSSVSAVFLTVIRFYFFEIFQDLRNEDSIEIFTDIAPLGVPVRTENMSHFSYSLQSVNEGFLEYKEWNTSQLPLVWVCIQF